MMMESTLMDSSASTVESSISSCREKFDVTDSMGYCLPERPRSRDWKIGDYIIVEKVYDNETSRVYKATCRASGMTVALKLYAKDLLHPVHHHQVMREIRIHSAIRHPNIVELYGSFEDEEYYYLVMEYADKGDLFDYTSTRQCGTLTEEETVSMVVLPMLNALEYLHARGIIHRDIKPENILLSSRLSGLDGTPGGVTAKLADFGLALNQIEERPVTRAGTLEYMPPEVVKNPGKSTPACNKDRADLAYAEKVDVWSLSVLAFEMLYSFPTFGTNEKSGVKAMIERSIMESKPRFFPGIREISTDAQDFISRGLRKAPSTRPSATALKRHRWIQQETLLMSSSGNDLDLIGSAYKADSHMQPDHKAVHRDPEWMAPSLNSDDNLFPEICEPQTQSQKSLRPKQPEPRALLGRLSLSMHEGRSRSPRHDKLINSAPRAMRHSVDSPSLTRQASSSPAQARRSLHLPRYAPPLKLGRCSMDSPSLTHKASSAPKPRQSLQAPSITNEGSPKLPNSSYRPLKQSSLRDRFAMSFSPTAAAQSVDSKGSSPGDARPSYRQRSSYESTRIMTKPTHRRHEAAHAATPPRRMSCEDREHDLGVFRGKTWKVWQMKA